MLSLTLAYLFLQCLRGAVGSPLQPSAGASINQQSNISVAARMQTQCDGARFGHNPDLADCRLALTRIPVARTKLTFMDRTKEPSEPRPDQKIEGLPFRVMGPEARCYVQVVLSDAVESGSASMGEIDHAASELVTRCAWERNSGGIATNIGGDNNLAIILGTYEPSIRCQGTIVNKVHCPAILWGMPAGTERQLFHPGTDPSGQVSLPIVIRSYGGECAMRIFTARNSDFTSWYKIWEAALAVYYACVRDGRGGIHSGLGEAHNLYLAMSGSVRAASGILDLAMEVGGNSSSLKNMY
ncbi:MAG: hypothetical protein HETSPECPRED_009654 [Heterodermia speciosa]|uniref:Effector protein n=1 Tax=Heterodermia speciosa TaxID=116794 RepID=A0A8H3ETQ0_9LECA|nr:MAG: hypothetical protein HETSPECPRED_009654 [Heterodermia speciosa]